MRSTGIQEGGDAITKTTLRRGSRLGKYRLIQRLGHGSFAEVWKARDSVESRDVALKIVERSAVTDWGRDAIEREARIAAKLTHQNVVSLRNADWIEGRFVLATDLATRSLAEYFPARRSPRVAIGVIGDATAGLAHAHKNRVLHLDLKPENIMIFSDGRAALADFGTSRIADRVTRTYTEAGTLGYIAPEQAYGRPRWASDVFSLGLVALELLVGRLPTWPFEWPPCEVGRFDRRVPEPVQRVLKKASDLDPSRRYRDAIALHEAWAAAMDDLTRQKTKAEKKAPRRVRAAPPLREVAASLFSRRHGRALGMRYLCHRCDGVIAEEMSFCPWCGSGHNSFREITSYPLVCPECERGVRPDWSACPWCYPGRFDAKGMVYRPDPQAIRRCSRAGCPGRLRRFMRYCPVCKQKPRRLWTDPHLPDRCTKCRWPVSGEYWRFCPWCGRSRR